MTPRQRVREQRQRWELERKTSVPLRPIVQQDGYADLPLFQTDIEEFTTTKEREPLT